MIKKIFFVTCLLISINCKEKTNANTPMIDSETETKSDNGKEILKWQTVIAKDHSKLVQRHEAAFTRVGQNFYLLGGRDIRAVSIFDTQSESWSTGAEPPIELHHFQPVVIDKKIYVIGALTGGWPDEKPTTHIYIYDTDADTWSKGHEIPEERRRGSTGNVLHDGKVYVACGIKNGHIGDHKKWMDLYNPATGTWEVLADAPRARDHFQAVLINGKIVAAAGRNTGILPDEPFGGTIAEVDSYDVESNTWETLSNKLPTQRAGNAATVFEGKVLVVGGESKTQEKAHAEVEALDMTTKEWKAMPALIEGRHGTGLLEYEGVLFIASGCGNRGGNPELFTMEKLIQ